MRSELPGEIQILEIQPYSVQNLAMPVWSDSGAPQHALYSQVSQFMF